MKCAVAFTIVGLLLLPAAVRGASQEPAKAQVLARESLWVHAVASHDPRTLSAILDDGFVHINYQGHAEGKAAMLARIHSRVPFEQHTSGQSVTLEGPVAIVHGLNTIAENGRVILMLCYTDVYVKRGATWKAISAQETAVSSASAASGSVPTHR